MATLTSEQSHLRSNSISVRENCHSCKRCKVIVAMQLCCKLHCI